MAFQDIVPYAEFNWWAILVSALSSIALGFAWFSIPGISRAWLAGVGKTMEQVKADKKGQQRAYAGTAVGALVLAIGMAILVSHAFSTTWSDGILLGLVAGLCFVATTLGATFLFEGKPLKLYLIDAGFHVVELAIMGVILSVWQ